MESEIISYILKQGAAVAFFILGFASAILLSRQVNQERFETLRSSIEYFKALIQQHEETASRRVREVVEINERLQKRIATLEEGLLK